MDFKLLNDVSFDKHDIIGDDPDRIRDWNPFVANMMLSLHPDAIMIVNETNCRPSMSAKQHYKYLLYMLPKRKRFAKKAKPKKVEDAEIIKEYYGYNMTRALEVVDLFSDQDIEELKQKMYKGGQKK